MKNNFDRTKTETSRFSVRAIAMVLFFVMLLTAIGSGSVISAIAEGATGPAVASAVKAVINGADLDEAILQKKGDSDLAGTGADFTSDGTAIIFIDNTTGKNGSDQVTNPWFGSADGYSDRVAFRSTSNGSVTWATPVKYDDTYYQVVVPSGTFKYILLTRHTNSDNWGEWGTTGEITIPTDKNCISAYKMSNSTATWSTKKIATTATLSASKTSNVELNESVTLTPNISSTTYNTYSTTEYSISPNTGASINENTFIATAAGTYTVTATVTYYANGYSGITSTAQQSVTISVDSQYSGLSATTNVTGAASANLTADIDEITDVSSLTGTTVTATNGDSGKYTFNGWTSSNGTFANANALSTTFYPSADNAVATANFTENSYTITIAKGTNGNTVSPTSITAHPYTTYALSGITATGNTGYKFNGWSAGAGITLSGQSSTNPQEGTLTATQAATLTATWIKENYTLTKGAEEHGTFTVTGTQSSGTKAQYLDNVTVTCVPDTGYKVSTVTYGPSGTGSTAEGSGNSWSFSMPAADTQVNVTFALDSYGITASASPASVGNDVSVSGNTGESDSTYKMVRIVIEAAEIRMCV